MDEPIDRSLPSAGLVGNWVACLSSLFLWAWKCYKTSSLLLSSVLESCVFQRHLGSSVEPLHAVSAAVGHCRPAGEVPSARASSCRELLPRQGVGYTVGLLAYLGDVGGAQMAET